jgi:NADH:ubiquinone oxidoreductase subunit F (NADH-binding)
VGGAPTLVDNLETLANVGIIALQGADHWRSAGTPEDPGSTLLTVMGAVDRPGVYEVAMGTHLTQVLAQAGGHSNGGVLIGGYFGTWLDPVEAVGTALTARSLAARNASLGCGLVAALPVGHCPLQEVSAVTAWLAANSAGQCGACVHGLPAIAGAVDRLGHDGASGADSDLDRWLPMVVGRGACKLPDGTARFVQSARRVFADHIDQHRRYGPCLPNPFRVLPTPKPGSWR